MKSSPSLAHLLALAAFVSASPVFAQATATATASPASPAQAVAAPAPAAGAAVVTGKSADQDYDAVLKLVEILDDDAFNKLPIRERIQKSESVLKGFGEASRAYAEAYPKEARRWALLVQSAYMSPLFVTGFKPDFDKAPGRDNVAVDEAAAKAYASKVAAQLEGIYTAEGVDPKVKVDGAGWFITRSFDACQASPSPEARAEARKRVDAFITALPADAEDSLVAAAPTMYLRILKQQAPGEVEAYKAELRKSERKALRELPDADSQRLAAFRDLASFAFTAVDGREIDIGKLRGKVVLVDFWATWCGPCVAELPNVKKVYQAYHDKGFEVIGISLDRSGAQNALQDFTKKNEMPWPQYYDGDGFSSKICEKYHIEAIPTMVLIDKDGNPAAIDARGPDLEPEVKRLLGL